MKVLISLMYCVLLSNLFYIAIQTAEIQSNEKLLSDVIKRAPRFPFNYGIGFSPPDNRHKRESTFYTVEEPVCPSRLEWKNMSQAVTAEGMTVEVIQGMFGWGNQWFYTVECENEYEGKPCRWIKESILSQTSCKTKENLVPAIISEPDSNSFDWKMIRIPSQCDCVRQQKVYV